jgi:hypothetical protein
MLPLKDALWAAALGGMDFRPPLGLENQSSPAI